MTDAKQSWFSKIWQTTAIQAKILGILVPFGVTILVGTVALLGSLAKDRAIKREIALFERIAHSSACDHGIALTDP